MTSPFPIVPSTPFAAVFSLNSPIGSEDRMIHAAPSYRVAVRTGPFQLLTTVPVRVLAPGTAGFTFDVRAHAFPAGRYLLVQTGRAREVCESEFGSASSEASEVAAKLALVYPDLIAEQLFEGWVTTPGQFAWGGPSMRRAVAREDNTPDELAQVLSTIDDALERLPEEERQRFRLASRWYTRGIAAENLVDRLLYWYVALEVHPAHGTTRVPRMVASYLQAHLYTAMSVEDIKSRLRLGHVTSMRGAIVHRGVSFVDPLNELAFAKDVELLGAVARACLGILAGVPSRRELDIHLGISALSGRGDG